MYWCSLPNLRWAQYFATCNSTAANSKLGIQLRPNSQIGSSFESQIREMHPLSVSTFSTTCHAKYGAFTDLVAASAEDLSRQEFDPGCKMLAVHCWDRAKSGKSQAAKEMKEGLRERDGESEWKNSHGLSRSYRFIPTWYGCFSNLNTSITVSRIDVSCIGTTWKIQERTQIQGCSTNFISKNL